MGLTSDNSLVAAVCLRPGFFHDEHPKLITMCWREDGFTVEAGEIAVDNDLLRFAIFGDVYGVDTLIIDFFCYE